MQAPPAVSLLLDQLQSFALDVKRVLSQPEVDWHCCPDKNEWSLTIVLCHLRDVEHEVHQPRFRSLLTEEAAFLSGAVADEWVEERAYRKQHGPTALAQFLAARRETLAMLPRPNSELWKRQGQHAFFGPTSMHELLNLVVQHDEVHWEQITNLLRLQLEDPTL